MSLIFRRHKRYSESLFLAANAVVVAALSVGWAQDARSAVFEQTDTGKVVEVKGGAFGDAPPLGEETSKGASALPASIILLADTVNVPEKTKNRSFGAVSERLSDIAGHGLDVVATLPGGVGATGSQDSVSRDAPADGSVAPVASRHPLASALSSAGATTDVTPRSAVIFQLGDKTSFPKARGLAGLSRRQVAMKKMSAKVGRQFAKTRGVRKSKMSEETFVELFTAMINRESNFDPHAVSPAGAQGLGQLMPGTARELGVENPFSALENLKGSAKYLTDLLDRFGSPELALAAYNAGPQAVLKHGGIPRYRETRQYLTDIFDRISRVPQGNSALLNARNGGSHTQWSVRQYPEPPEFVAQQSGIKKKYLLTAVLRALRGNPSHQEDIDPFAYAAETPLPGGVSKVVENSSRLGKNDDTDIPTDATVAGS